MPVTEVDPFFLRGQAKFFVFFGGQINDDQPVDPGGDRIDKESIDAARIDRVVVTHHHDRCGVVFLAKGAGQIERLCQGLAAFEGALSIGSVKGIPNSMISTPAAGRPLTISSPLS